MVILMIMELISYVVNLVFQALMICVCDDEYSHKHW